MSVLGAVSLLTYFPGGWLADTVSSRKLITFSMLAPGLAGFFFASFPSYALSIVVHGFWGATCSLTFWGAMIKATRNWAPASEQGRAFGILESGRGIAEPGPDGNFLNIAHTLGYFRERWYPKVFERMNFETWQKKGGGTCTERASETVSRILEEHRPEPLPDRVRTKLRDIVGKARPG